MEIERKYIVNAAELPQLINERNLTQWYIALEPEIRMRIATSTDGEKAATLTVKGKGDIVRPETEAELSPNEAVNFQALRYGRLIRKVRSEWPDGHGLLWEIDRYQGELEGLLIAEIELGSEDQVFDLPSFAGKEVTTDKRFKNRNLAVEGLSVRELLALQE